MITSICENLFVNIEDEYVGYVDYIYVDRHTRILNLEGCMT